MPNFLIPPAFMPLAGLRFNVAVDSALPLIAMNSLVEFLDGIDSHPVKWTFLASISMLATFGIFIRDLLASRFSGNTLKTNLWLIGPCAGNLDIGKGVGCDLQ